MAAQFSWLVAERIVLVRTLTFSDVFTLHEQHETLMALIDSGTAPVHVILLTPTQPPTTVPSLREVMRQTPRDFSRKLGWWVVVGDGFVSPLPFIGSLVMRQRGVRALSVMSLEAALARLWECDVTLHGSIVRVAQSSLKST